MRHFIIVAILCSLVLTFFPAQVLAFSLVPCGTAADKGGPNEICDFGDLVGLLMRMINYLISVAGIVAMYNILSRGFDLITAVGNPEKIQHAKEGISNALVGFGMILLAFVFINLVVNLIFASPGATRPWWDPQCIYNITDPPAGCLGRNMLAPAVAHAQASGEGTTELTNPLPYNEPGEIVKWVFAGFAGIIGLIAMAFIVFSGFKLVVATEEEAINTAKQSLTWAVGGFIVALLSFTLVASTANILGFEPSRVPTSGTLVNPVTGTCTINGQRVACPGPQGPGFLDVLGDLMVNFLGLLGFATVLMIIYYGYRYITSSGNEEAIEKAKVGLRWAITGFIVSLLAFTIVTAIRQYLVFGPPTQ